LKKLNSSKSPQKIIDHTAHTLSVTTDYWWKWNTHLCQFANLKPHPACYNRRFQNSGWDFANNST